MNTSKNTAVKAKKPGTSRKLCNIPISFPVKLAASLLKLLIKAAQVEKANGMMKAIINKRVAGDFQDSLNFIAVQQFGGLWLDLLSIVEASTIDQY